MKNIPALIVLALLLTGSLAFGQAKKNASRADRFYELLGYHAAIQAYGKGEPDAGAMEQLAHSYRLNGDTRNAEFWYARVVGTSHDPLNFLYYAQALQSNGKHGLAREYFLRYDQMAGGRLDKRGGLQAEAIDQAGSFDNKNTVEVRLEKNVNSAKLDFSPAFFGGGIVFVSNRRAGTGQHKPGGKDPWTGDDFATIYFSKIMENGELGEPEIFEPELMSRFHEGPLTFSRSGELLFFTRNDPKNTQGEVKLKIYQTEKNNGHWAVPELTDLGDATANDVHPSLSPDGRLLFFASDREGGYGGMDLYVVKSSNGNWGAPVNLGPSVNTPGNEVFPFVFRDGTLYFASDGWGGLGGLDIFFAEPVTENGWTVAANLGAPFNSPKDDFGYILDPTGSKGYFTSARDGGLGKDDIYSFVFSGPKSHLKNNRSREVTFCVVEGSSGRLLPGVDVSVMEEMAQGGYRGYDGDFLVKMVPADVPGGYDIFFEKRDPFASVDAETETWTTGPSGKARVALNPEKNYLIVLKSKGYKEKMHFVTAAELSAEALPSRDCIQLAPAHCPGMGGRVLNKRDGSAIPGATVTLIDLCTGKLLPVKSDASGRYGFPCVPCGCDFIVQGAKPGFKLDNNLASTVGLDCHSGSELLERDLLLMPSLHENVGHLGVAFHPEDTERPATDFFGEKEVFEKILSDGLTVELENIYYDFDKSDIRPDAAAELDKVAGLLHRQPGLKVELRSHTDARGDGSYNLRLSAARASAAADYLAKRGIDRSRIEAKGYGETWPVNECGEGATCPESSYQMNRRTEVRLFK